MQNLFRMRIFLSDVMAFRVK